MEMPSIYDFLDPVDFLLSFHQYQKVKNPQFSMRAWANQIDFSNVALLSMILKRKRSLLPKNGEKLSRWFIKKSYFKEKEAQYFSMLVNYSKSSTQEDKIFFKSQLTKLLPKSKTEAKKEQLNFLTNIWNIIVLEMASLENFQSDTKWIAKEINYQISEKQISEILEKLYSLKFLEIDANGNVKRTNQHFASPIDIPDDKRRKTQKQFIEKSLSALENHPIDFRNFCSFTLSTNKSKISEAKNKINDFIFELANFMECKNADSVYQINIQLFDLLNTKNK